MIVIYLAAGILSASSAAVPATSTGGAPRGKRKRRMSLPFVQILDQPTRIAVASPSNLDAPRPMLGTPTVAEFYDPSAMDEELFMMAA